MIPAEVAIGPSAKAGARAKERNVSGAETLRQGDDLGEFGAEDVLELLQQRLLDLVLGDELRHDDGRG